MIKKLKNKDLKNFCKNFCEHFSLNEVAKYNLKVSIFKNDGILAIVDGVKTADGHLYIRFEDDSLLLYPKHSYRTDVGKGRFVFNDHKDEINKYYTDFMTQKFGQSYLDYCKNKAIEK